MNKIHLILIILTIFIIDGCRNYSEKRQYVKEKLEKTNKHVEEGAWYAKTHGPFIVPDILKDTDKVLQQIQLD